MARAKEQGYDVDNIQYHGTRDAEGRGITEIDPNKQGGSNPSARGTGFWASANPNTANTYTGGLGSGGAVYPLLVKRGDEAVVDFGGSSWSDLPPETPVRIRDGGASRDDMELLAALDESSVPENYNKGSVKDVPAGSIDVWDTNGAALEAADRWHDSIRMSNVSDPGVSALPHLVDEILERKYPQLKSLKGKELYDFKMSIPDEDWDSAYKMAEEVSRTPSENVAVFSPNDVKSTNAAFDPQYIGPNMLGNATPGFMALLGAGGAGATAAARGSHPVSQQAGQLWDDLKGTAQGLLDVAEMPARGLQGLGRVGYGMLTGEGFDESMRQGNDVLQGGTEAAAKRAGDEVFKRTGSAEMATAAYTAVMTGSPI
jgi:hypothetical protein